MRFPILLLLTICVAEPSSGVVAPPAAGPRLVRYVSGAADNTTCDDSSVVNAQAVNTTERLAKLRQLMAQHGVAAYIITGSDAHGSEYIAAHDQRRSFISGFSGSSGDAVVTMDEAAVWTDSRYYLQARQQLDCNWKLMRQNEPKVPPISKWLADQLPNGSYVGADPSILTYQQWKALEADLTKRDKMVKAIETNLVDIVWGADQPQYPSHPITILPNHFAGETWVEKVRRVQSATSKLGGDLLVLNALDDAAWLFNLRSNEVAFTPVFRAYVVVPTESSNDSVRLYIPSNKITDQITQHLTNDWISVRILDYDQIWSDLPKLAANATKVLLPKYEAGNAGGASQRLYTSVPANKVMLTQSPVISLRNKKNPVEIDGMRNSHIRDAVALCQMLATLEKEVPLGVYWDELMVSSRLSELRAAQNLSEGDSFGSIVAVGPHSAMPHYKLTEDTNEQITKDDILLIDSGGQYLDGTTDVTRTVHFATPTDLQVNVYTRLLQGCASLAQLVFPAGKTYPELDVVLRAPLYQLGLDYGHGSTHGIGAYLAVHEAFDTAYQENFFGSQEPGFYKDGHFGMRLENIVQAVKAKTQYDNGRKFLTFDTTTLVPYERKFINVSLMTFPEIKWVNDYYSKIRKLVGAEMLRQGLNETYQWLLNKTEPINKG